VLSDCHSGVIGSRRSTDKGEAIKVALEIKCKRIAVLPPIGKQKHDPALDLTVIPASERGTPKGRSVASRNFMFTICCIARIAARRHQHLGASGLSG
jgi:hypothetical protein